MNIQTPIESRFPAERELVIERVFDAPREKVYRAWTEPKLLKQWFVPRPWTISGVALDVRPGGQSHIVMRDPEGKDHPNQGIYLEVVENEKLVFTDAFTAAWEPSEKPFVLCIVIFEDMGDGKTRYLARVRHWTIDDCNAHEKMGFHDGWGQAADQLAELLKTI